MISLITQLTSQKSTSPSKMKLIERSLLEDFLIIQFIFMFQDMDAEASDQFWMTLQSRGEENLARIKNSGNSDKEKFNHMLFETAASLNNLQQSKPNNPANNINPMNLPKIQFENIIPKATAKPVDNSLYVSPATPQVQNQFMLQEKLRQKLIEEMNKNAESSTSIHVFNPGSSGLQTVQGSVPLEQNDQMFSVGGSLTVGGGGGGGVNFGSIEDMFSSTTARPADMMPGASITVQPQGASITVQPQGVDRRLSQSLQPEVGVYPSGDDPHILLSDQVQAGTPLPQGPHGPMIPKPKPASFPVAQTPKAPQIVQPSDPMPGTKFSPLTRGGASGVPLAGSHQQPGPGNYIPPLDTSPSLDGEPGSGQQLIKHYLIHAKEQAKHVHAQQKQHQQQQQQQLQQHQLLLQQQLQEEMQRQMLLNQQMNMVQQPSPQPIPMSQQPSPQQSQLPAQPPQIPSNVLQHRNSAPGVPSRGPTRRQDILSDVIPSAAVGALTSGLTPISIFSNLLNAYATLDSKHDITGKLLACFGLDINFDMSCSEKNKKNVILLEYLVSKGMKQFNNVSPFIERYFMGKL